MRQKVLQAAGELGYHPNHLARSLITGKSGIVGVVIGNPRNTFHLEALDELSGHLHGLGRHLQVFTAQSEGNSDELVEALLRFRVDTLLLMSVNISPALIARCQAIGVPVIFFNRRPPVGAGIFGVTGANFQGATTVAQHLLDQGYRRPAIITASENSSTSKEREAGFVEGIIAAGLDRPATERGSHGRGAIPAARKLLSLDPRPDAIFCTSDYMAMAALETARFEFGLEIGPQIGIAGFDDTEGASWRSFSITTYSQPVGPMIEQVTKIILDASAFESTPVVVIPGQLKVRDSTIR
jgi:DNA-binding LacI/PurR family transcriptional regulator